MKKKMITLETCAECPHRDHSGGFTKGGAIPMCMAMMGEENNYMSKDLPYTRDSDTGRRIATNVIPSWCPLDNVEV